jgi:hypothetical protein
MIPAAYLPTRPQVTGGNNTEYRLQTKDRIELKHPNPPLSSSLSSPQPFQVFISLKLIDPYPISPWRLHG